MVLFQFALGCNNLHYNQKQRGEEKYDNNSSSREFKTAIPLRNLKTGTVAETAEKNYLLDFSVWFAQLTLLCNQTHLHRLALSTLDRAFLHTQKTGNVSTDMPVAFTLEIVAQLRFCLLMYV